MTASVCHRRVLCRCRRRAGRGAARRTKPLTTTVLFDREIVRILNSHCVMCHVGEWAVLSARDLRADVAAEAEDQRRGASRATCRRGPAFPGYGQFANENSLTLRETQFIVSWVEGLGPRNAGTVFTNTSTPSAAEAAGGARACRLRRWQLGEPRSERAARADHDRARQPNDVKRTVDRSRIDDGAPASRDRVHAGRSPRGARGVLHRSGNRASGSAAGRRGMASRSSLRARRSDFRLAPISPSRFTISTRTPASSIAAGLACSSGLDRREPRPIWCSP